MESIGRSNIDEWINDIHPSMIKWRRRFHQHPETGWTEYITTYEIAKNLEPLGFRLFIGKDALLSEARMGVPNEEELITADERAGAYGISDEFLEKVKGGHTGVVAKIESGKPGPHFAFRFDIDALPVFEAEQASHVPYEKGFSSKERGKMHACAHDGHTSIGLAYAHFLSTHLDILRGSFTLLFQPAEEGSRGAKAMVEKGWLDHVDWFISGHIGIKDLTIGQLASTTTDFLATTKFDVSFSGTASHAGAKPEEGRNALLAAAACAQHLHAISRHSEGTTRLNVGTLHAGTGRNIIPDRAVLTGETRGETNVLNSYMYEEAERIVKASASLYGVDSAISIVGEGISAECDNDFISFIEKAADQSKWLEKPMKQISAGASEDATHMIKRVQESGGKATYMIYGTPLAAGHHHPSFDYDEDVLLTGLSALIYTTLQILEEQGESGA
ncbi:amidohydrolase [Bacillus sp. FJAT-44742]|uniref:amidohydrolase n=1 Tax=Bacillus sp. FJAT-44742 TaxID=2014005 RepID=UPI000C232EE7|nr:amidohydrolase [Bacillus sp. FJAT-44742]